MAERILQDEIAEQKKRLTMAQINKDTEEEADAYYNLGKAYYSLRDFHQAIECFKQNLSIAEEASDRESEAIAYKYLGAAYDSLSEFQRAIECHKKSLTIAQEIGYRKGEGCAYGNLGNVYDSLCEFQRAIECHKKSLTIAQEIGDRKREGCAYGNLGNAYHSLSEFQRAKKYHKQHLSIAKEVGNKTCELKAYGNLGNAYDSLSEFQRAIEYQKKSLRIAKEIGEREGEGNAYANLGVGYRSLSEFQRAIEYHKKSLSIAQEIGDREGEGGAYGNLGNAYQSLSEFQRAIEYHKKSLSIAQEIGDREGEGCAYCSLGCAYQSLSDFPQAMEYHKKHLTIANKVGNRVGEGIAYSNLGEIYSSLGDHQRAIGCYKQHLSTAKKFGDRRGEGVAYCHLGNAYYLLEDYLEALEYFNEHLRIAEEIGDRNGEGCAHNHLGRSLRQLGFLNEALHHFRCSVEIFDTIRASFISEDRSKISFCTSKQSAYTDLWQVLLLLERNDEALYAAERGRAQALLDALKVTYGLTSSSPRSIESEEEVRNIARKATVLTVFLALGWKTVNIWVLGKEGNPIFRQVEIEIGREHEDSFTLLLDTVLKGWNVKRGKEGNPTFRQPEIEIGREHEHFFTLLLDTVLKNIRAGVGIRCENRSMDKLRDESTSSSTPDDNQTSESSQESTDLLQPLYDAVLGPIEDLLDGDELIVVPDGALSKAPWAALSETLRIRTVPSLTSLKVITDSPSEYHSKSGALLVGDPCLEKVTDENGKPTKYSPLKYARMEVEMIGRILGSQPLTGEDATKKAVLQRIGSVALVHIAAHGKKETGEIFLAPDRRWESKPPTEEACIMKMSDIQAVRLRARLVVLSCCYSGQGEVSSEGVVGMARALLFAGARSVLATLWAVDDEATMMFMESFYQQLGSGESASVALQRAMKCLRDSPDYSAPKYWAPFVLMGDDVKIELKKESLSKSDALKV